MSFIRIDWVLNTIPPAYQCPIYTTKSLENQGMSCVFTFIFIAKYISSGLLYVEICFL